MSNKLHFRDIPAVDKDVYTLREETLNNKASRGVNIKKVNKWYLGKPSNSPFNKYLENVIPVDYHRDTDVYRRSLDFNKRGSDPSFTFKSLKEDLNYIEDDSNLEEYEDISQLVQDAFADYLDTHKHEIRKYLKNSKVDINNLSAEFFNSICTDASLEVMKDPHIREMNSPELEEYLAPIFEELLESYTLNEAKYVKPELPKYMEVSARHYKNECLGYIVEKSVSDRNEYGKLRGPFLSLCEDEKTYELSEYVEDAEIFESQEDADEGARLFCMQGLIGEWEKESGMDIDDEDRLELENTASDIVWEDFKITPIYYSDIEDTSDTFRESRIGDVEIICQEFDEKYPKGHPKRDEYHLTSLLQRFMNLDAITASNIANSWLTRGYFTH